MTPDQDGPILVPVDFSEHSERALLWAARAAEAYGRRLLVLHVVHDLEFAPGYYKLEDPEGHIRRLEEAAAEMMEEFIGRAREANPEADVVLGRAETALAVGLPPTRILEIAKQARASLIVMGSHGRTGLGSKPFTWESESRRCSWQCCPPC